MYSDPSPTENLEVQMQIFIFCYQFSLTSRGDLDLTWGGHVAYHLMQLDERNISAPSLCLYLNPIKSYKWKRMLTLWRHYMTLNSLSRCHICKNGPVVITISLNDHSSEWFEQIWWVIDSYIYVEVYGWVYNVFELSPLTYLRTWPEVNHIRIPRYTSCRYQMIYQILRFSNLPLHHCGCGTIANFFFEDCVTWPGLVTWAGVTWSQIFHKMCKKDVKIAFVLHYREKPRKRGKFKHPE